MEIKNVTLKKYLEKGEPIAPLEHIKGKPEYNGKTFNSSEMTYKDVKHVFNLFSSVTTWEVIETIFKICFKEEKSEWFYSGKVVEFYQARNFIIQEFKRLMEQEQKLLKSINTINTDLWRQAGGNRLNRFGGILALNQLAKTYYCYPFELENKPYMEILVLLTIEKETKEVTKRYEELKKELNLP